MYVPVPRPDPDAVPQELLRLGRVRRRRHDELARARLRLPRPHPLLRRRGRRTGDGTVRDVPQRDLHARGGRRRSSGSTRTAARGDVRGAPRPRARSSPASSPSANYDYGFFWSLYAGRRDRAGGQAHRHPLRGRHRRRASARCTAARSGPACRPRRTSTTSPCAWTRAVDGPLQPARRGARRGRAGPGAATRTATRCAPCARCCASEAQAARLADPGARRALAHRERDGAQPLRRADRVPAARRLHRAAARAGRTA